MLERTRGWAALHRPYRPAEGLAVLLLLAAVAFPHEYRPFLPAVLPLALVAPGVSRALALWLATNALSFLLTPSCTGKVLLLLEGIFPAVGGNLLGSFFREAKTDVCWVLVGFGWPIALLGLAQWWAAKPAPWAWLSAAERWLLPTRITGSFGNPNLFAGFLLVLLPLEAGLLLREERLLRRGLATGSLLLHSLVLALTFSHGAWLAAVGTMVLFSLCLQRLRRRELLTLVALGGVLAPVLLNHPWGGTLSHRLRIYRGALGLFLKYPLGTGAGGFLAYYPHQAGAVVAAHCHNIILQIMVEQGVVGLAVFVYLLLSWFRQGRKLTAPKMAGFLALMGGQLLYGVVDYVWATPLLTALFWLAEGYCFGPGEVTPG
ncbi:MAG TPA: O-antigen ligase family protein [Bacillota bacterium]|nr:O-antigen ligase family protein [Bacillota bacterium]